MKAQLFILFATFHAIFAHIQSFQWKFSCIGKPDGNYRDPENCSKFYICSNYHTYSMNCVSGTHYHYPSDQCLWRHEANCVPNPCELRPNGNYKDPSHCDKYITCVWGLTYSMNCYYGLFYDEKKDQCVYPNEVECN